MNYFLVTDDWSNFFLRLAIKNEMHFRPYYFFNDEWHIDEPMGQPSIMHSYHKGYILLQFEDDKQ
jgi:hypothetical protein